MAKAFGIFEGGGAKGLAHIGALRAAEQYEVEFVGVAGASAGAIVASLIAVKYSSKELFDLEDTEHNKVFDKDFVDLLGRNKWNAFSKLRRFGNFCSRYYSILRTVLVIVGICSVPITLIVISQLNLLLQYLYSWSLLGTILVIYFILTILIATVLHFSKKLPLGFFSTADFETWLNEQLSEKIFPGEKTQEVKFKHLTIPLEIVATDIKAREIVVFNKKNFPEYSVAEAVGASISIPIAFQPHIVRGRVLVDGGVLSNFPAWVFDQLRKEQVGIVPTIGFRLQNVNSETITEVQNPTDLQTTDSSKEMSIKRFVTSLLTVFFGDNILEKREIDDLHLIPIKVGSGTLDFDVDRAKKRILYIEGENAANRFFKQFTGPKHEEEIKAFLKIIHDNVRHFIDQPEIHLRVNIALLVEPHLQKLRITYTYNMDDDSDDKLALGLNEGAIGKCWQTKKPILANMVEARTNYASQWNMNKYDQALVRKDLQTLISFPVFEPKTLDTSLGTGENKLLAVLSIDSDVNLMKEFGSLDDGSDINFEMQSLLESFAINIAQTLRS